MIRKQIIERCHQHNYFLIKMEGKDGKTIMMFENKNVRKELDTFIVDVDNDLERVTMVILMNLGSWNDAYECDLNDTEKVLEGIDMWISKEGLKEAEEWFLGDE